MFFLLPPHLYPDLRRNL